MSTTDFWKTKLAALLHDPPDKCLNIADHDEAAQRFPPRAGLSGAERGWHGNHDTDAVHAADCFTASADCFAFPKNGCDTIFKTLATGEFIHPLSSERHELKVAELLEKSGEIHEILQSAIHGIDSDDPRKALFLCWRRWLENAVSSGSALAGEIALFPADSRIPDHSIWVHNTMTSALAGCAQGGNLRPALLMFQLGGVQDFIAQARSTRYLWSGSYLLSWLMAHAMKAVSDEVGPDSIVFPNLRGNGIFDALHRDNIYDVIGNGKNGQETLWEKILQEKEDARTNNPTGAAAKWLLTPTLPNRFLAVVPAERAEELAAAATKALSDELGKIGDAVWKWLDNQADRAGCQGKENWKLRWDAQLRAFPQTSWAVQPWLEREECLRELEKLPVNRPLKGSPLETLQKTLWLAETWIAEHLGDKRFHADKDVTKPLLNSGIFWAAHYALVDAKLAARRNTNVFSAWVNPWPEASVKDSLSGKEEIIGDEKFWKHLHDQFRKKNQGSGFNLFATGTHKYGTMNLIKRLWCRDGQVAYLRERLGLTESQFNRAMEFDSVEQVAIRNRRKGKYVAVLAMDGDEMGKWVSGQKTPEFLKQLSARARACLEPILKANNSTDLRRLLTPSYHLQFSEALANFATALARPIVEAFDGQLIYAGGDDVLAMLPADQAIPCAQALRAVFRGEPPADRASMPLHVTENGFVMAAAGYPLMVPGKKADVSIGLAIGHCEAPLQMLVKEAQAAEHCAKHHYGRGAIAFSLYKRSGEIIQWGCKWDSQALPLMQMLDRLGNPPEPKKNADQTTEENGNGRAAGFLSGRFPYALAELLQPYQLHRPLTIKAEEMQNTEKKKREKAIQDTAEEIRNIIAHEVDHVISRQASELLKAARKNSEAKEQLERLRSTILAWLTECIAGEVARLKQLLDPDTEKLSFSADNTEAGEVARLKQPSGLSVTLGDFIQPFLTETFINRGPGGVA